MGDYVLCDFAADVPCVKAASLGVMPGGSVLSSCLQMGSIWTSHVTAEPLIVVAEVARKEERLQMSSRQWFCSSTQDTMTIYGIIWQWLGAGRGSKRCMLQNNEDLKTSWDLAHDLYVRSCNLAAYTQPCLQGRMSRVSTAVPRERCPALAWALASRAQRVDQGGRGPFDPRARSRASAKVGKCSGVDGNAVQAPGPSMGGSSLH